MSVCCNLSVGCPLFVNCHLYLPRGTDILDWNVEMRPCSVPKCTVFEMKGLINILRVSWTAKKTNEWVLNKAGVKRELLDTVKNKEASIHRTMYGHTVRKQVSCLEKEVMQGTTPGARRRGRLRTAWMDNIKTCTGLSVEESVRMTEDK